MQFLKSTLVGAIFLGVGVTAGWFLHQLLPSWSQEHTLLSPLQETVILPQPLKKYALARLKNYPLTPSKLTIEEELSAEKNFTSYLFTYQTMGKRMSGQINIPSQLDKTQEPKVIVMIRGYVPPAIYSTGIGTKNAAAYFAQRGFITVAPDFFGFGTSSLEFSDEWEARLAKPIEIMELITSIQKNGVPVDATAFQQLPTQKIGIWAHSNGGQIALSTLQGLGESIPTTLWAPVTAPFPYSVLFFSDEEADEGKKSRAWIAAFEKQYDVFDFSLTQHLDLLTGPLQFHHGTIDDAALIAWSDEFVDKVNGENGRRKAASSSAMIKNSGENQIKTTESKIAATAAANTSILAQPIEITYFRYPGADHNLQPNWEAAVQRDVAFFGKYLK